MIKYIHIFTTEMNIEVAESSSAGIPKRLARATELILGFTNNVEEIGFSPGSIELLESLPLPVILAPTHLSDWDITATIYALAKFTNINVKIVTASTHDSFRQNPAGKVGSLIAGPENFIPISYTKKRTEMGLFNVDDFNEMRRATEEGNSIVIAAFHDRRCIGHNQFGVALPSKPGVGAAYLSLKTGLPIVPVAVNMEANKGRIFERPGIEISVGEPINLENPKRKVEKNNYLWS